MSGNYSEYYLDQGRTQLEEVEVDQRALVNILSRYPGPFDVLRELIQNADDAEARCVEVQFLTSPELDIEPCQPTSIDVCKVNVSKWIIKNDGNVFQEKDWKRLTRIADGNDNSSKVGAFGVGFYSVLSKSDKPIVKSNGKLLQFYRRTDGKLCKRFTDCVRDSWTSVELELHSPEPLGTLADLTRFLLSSLTFLTNIHTISIDLNAQNLLRVRKEPYDSPVNVPIPAHLMPNTPLKALTVESIQRIVQRVMIETAEWAFTSVPTPSSLADAPDSNTLLERLERSGEDNLPRLSRLCDTTVENVITHDLYTATIHVNLDPESEMKKGVESSLKLLPSSFRCMAAYFNCEQHNTLAVSNDSHTRKAELSGHVLSDPQGIIPGNDGGRLFIGQSTNQTTGIGMHISAHFLPTIERGAVDLANGQVAAWNKEVLWVSGLLARVIYEEEMRTAARLKDDLATKRGLTTMARFAFGSTSPHSGVSKILQDAFFSCGYESPFPVVSELGISCISHSCFRQSNEGLSFLTKYQVLHREIIPTQCTEIIDRYKIPQFKFGDIVREFEIGVTQDAMVSFFGWWDDVLKNSLSSPKSKDATEHFCKEFPSRGVLLTSNGTKIPLKNIKYYTFFPLPNDLSPSDALFIDVSTGAPNRCAIECFGWRQLQPLDWLEYACTQANKATPHKDCGQDPDVGYRMLRILIQFALAEDLSRLPWDRIAELVKDIKCIPTNMGLKLPNEAYFDEVDVCRSLPVASESDFLDIPATPVTVETRRSVRKVLAHLHVRQMMNWEDMVGKLETVASVETNTRLLQYLTMIHPPSDQQICELRMKKVFYSENHGRVSGTELYLPNEDMRKLQLPILALPWNAIASLQSIVDPSGSFVVESFIKTLGVSEYPTLEKIISLAASNVPEVHGFALQYLLSNLETHYDAYRPDDFANIAFIPTQDGTLAPLNEVFASPLWERLGFKRVSEALRRDLSRLGVKDDPSIETIVGYLKTPRTTLPDIDTAATWFEHLYLHARIPIPKLRDHLSLIPFVPVKNSCPSPSESPLIEYHSPKDCFINSAETKRHHRAIFPFVDFGPNANSFLESCSAEKAPDESDIVRKIVRDPQRYLEVLHNDTKLYLEDLRMIASRLEWIPEEDKQAMKKAPMFPAFCKRAGERKLLPADQVVVSDWESRDFGSNVFIAPNDAILENMYNEMGSEFLGTYVRHDIHHTDYKTKVDPPFSRDHVIRRVRFFMDQRDKRGKIEVSFYYQGCEDKLRIKTCKTLTLKKTFAPPFGILADGGAARTIETNPVPITAGIESNESDGSLILWVVKGSNNRVEVHNDIAVALCRVLLKTYGPNDVLLLASLFGMEDKRLEEYYGNSTKSGLPSVPQPTVAKNKIVVQVPLAPFLVKMVGVLRPGSLIVSRKKTHLPENDVEKAIALWGKSDPNGQPYDFTVPTSHQPHSTNSRKPTSRCKLAHNIRLKERKDLQDARTHIRVFISTDAQCQHPPQHVLGDFAELVSALAEVFGQDASKACYIFWKDTDEDLMGFNWDQKYVFFNLAHYHRFFHNKGLEKKKVITEWFLILAHEIAHNVTLDHDEYHGSLCSRLAITYLPALQKHFSMI